MQEHPNCFFICESHTHFRKSTPSILKDTEIPRSIISILESLRKELIAQLKPRSDIETGELFVEDLPLLSCSYFLPEHVLNDR